MYKIPWSRSKANAYMRFNPLKKREIKKVKYQAKREFRRYQKSILLEELEAAKNGN
jgi:hypothetical protein